MIRLDFGNPVIWLGISHRRSFPPRFIINWIHHDYYGAIIFTSPINTEFAIHNNPIVYGIFAISFLKPVIIQQDRSFKSASWMRYSLLQAGDIYDIWLNKDQDWQDDDDHDDNDY